MVIVGYTEPCNSGSMLGTLRPDQPTLRIALLRKKHIQAARPTQRTHTWKPWWTVEDRFTGSTYGMSFATDRERPVVKEVLELHRSYLG